MNERLPPETFEFVPPADALDVSDPHSASGRISSGGGASGGITRYQGGNWFESWHSHDWAGETLIELWGLDLAFERRLTLSDDRDELPIVERITGPQGQTERELSLPVVQASSPGGDDDR